MHRKKQGKLLCASCGDFALYNKSRCYPCSVKQNSYVKRYNSPVLTNLETKKDRREWEAYKDKILNKQV
jgi:hypothetical protein